MKLRRAENWNDWFKMPQKRNKSICGLCDRLYTRSNQKQKKIILNYLQYTHYTNYGILLFNF